MGKLRAHNVMADDRPRRAEPLPFARPYVSEAAIDEVVATLRSGWLVTGPKVGAFEDKLAAYTGSEHALATNSCTAAMHLALLAAGVGPGDEVITTPLTFVATANAILHAGAVPVFADVHRFTQTIDPQRVADLVTPRTRAILPMHMAGRPCELDDLQRIADHHDLVVVEDAAHALGAWYHGRPIGATADASCFSFHATKVLTTGEGGLVTTRHSEWAETVRVRREHGLRSGAWGRSDDNDGVVGAEVGFKYNMSDIQAALGLHAVDHIDERRARREEIWRMYDDAFVALPAWVPPAAAPDTRHARHLYTLLLDVDALTQTRGWIRRALREENIGTSVHFLPVPLHPYMQGRPSYEAEDAPNAEWIAERTISLPLTADLTDDDVADVISAVNRVLTAAAKD